MSSRVSSSPGLPAIGLPEAKPGTGTPAQPGPATLPRPADGLLRRRTATMAGESSPAPPRASIDLLRDPKRRAVSGLAFTHHTIEPAPGQARHARTHAHTGKTYESTSAHRHSQAQVGTWVRSEETVGLNAGGHGALGLRAAGFGELGVGARGQAQFVKHGRLGDATVQGGGELGATVQGSGQVSAGLTGLNVQAGGQAWAGLQAESGVALQAHDATVKLHGVRVDVTPNADAKGHASLGAEGGGSVFAGVRVPTAQERAAGTGFKAGVEASGSAFAGAKAEGDTHVGLGGNQIGVAGGVWAGAGAEGKVNGSLTQVNGHTTARLELKAGVALGVGGSLGFTAQVDVQPVVDAAHKVATLGRAVAHHLT